MFSDYTPAEVDDIKNDADYKKKKYFFDNIYNIYPESRMTDAHKDTWKQLKKKLDDYAANKKINKKKK
jgi:hypothetical protein